MNDRLRQFLIVFLTISTLVMVALAMLLPLGGHSTAYVSDKYYSAITPAGWAFSIWSLIYSGLIAFTVWQALPAQRENPRLRVAGPWVMGICLANGLWLVAWHNVMLPLSLLIIAFYLLCCVHIVEAFNQPDRPRHGAEFWLGFVAFSIYAGWLTIATTANATVVLLSQGFSLGLNDTAWGVIILTVAFLIGWALFTRWQSPAYFLVITWAFTAIASAHTDRQPILITALALAGVAAALSIQRIVQKKESA